MKIGKRLGAGASAVVMSAGVMIGITATGSPGLASASGCISSGGTVMRPTPIKAYGVGSGSCGDIGTCVTTTLFRQNRAVASQRQCGIGNVEASTSWVVTNPLEKLWTDVQVVPNA